MAQPRARSRVSTATWIAYTLVIAGFLYIAAKSYALELGAAHHDAFCPEHGWAV